MIFNGPVNIRLTHNPSVRWREPIPYSNGYRHVADCGDLQAILTVFGHSPRKIPRIALEIWYKPFSIRILGCGDNPRMALPRAKAIVETVLTALQPMPSCPNGCHVPYGHIPIDDHGQDDAVNIHWTTWQGRQGIGQGVFVICHQTILFPGGMVPIDPENIRRLPMIEVPHDTRPHQILQTGRPLHDGGPMNPFNGRLNIRLVAHQSGGTSSPSQIIFQYHPEDGNYRRIDSSITNLPAGQTR